MASSLCALALLLAPFGNAPAAGDCTAARQACLSAVRYTARACTEVCRSLPDAQTRRTCRTACRSEGVRDATVCTAVTDPCRLACGVDRDLARASNCESAVRSCRGQARKAHRACRRACQDESDGAGQHACRPQCDRERATAEASCGYGLARAVSAAPELPVLPTGQAADLSLLEAEERAVIAQADARAVDLRSRPLRIWVGEPGAKLTITQTRHSFQFGFATDLGRISSEEDRAWFTKTMASHFSLAVLENDIKWRAVEPRKGERDFADAEELIEWAEDLGMDVKGHTLQWGNGPPLSSTGVPQWLIDRFPRPNLTSLEQAELRELIRQHVLDTVERFRGRLAIWDATNETLQPFTQWFLTRLGPTIVEDVFRWAHQADPSAQLVFNEWIVEVFTGLPGPTAADVRDRVLDLLAAGVPVHALGQQTHFVPGAAFVGVPVDLSQRTHIDDYAIALDTLAEAGLPIHLTETNFIAPEEPEARAAQAEGLMRLWWGHPSVEQIVFWGPWNAIAGRDEFDVGLWDDDKNLSRHGQAVVSLLNDRWRTRASEVADAQGFVELQAHLGEYAVEWSVSGTPVHATFHVGAFADHAAIALAPP